MKIKTKEGLAVCLLFSLCLSTSFAVEEQKTVNISTEVIPTCVINYSTEFMVNYNPQIDSFRNEMLELTCTKDTSYSVSLSQGNSGNVNARYLKSSSGATLNYKMLFKANNGAESNWGDGENGINGFGLGEKQFIQTMFILLPNQFVEPSVYTDNLTVNLNY